MIIMRADGNFCIGTGHIMRCLSLADALREHNKDVVFVIAGPDFQEMIQTRGYICEVLGTSYDRMEEELPIFMPILEREQPELVIVDSYFVTPEYMKAVKILAKLLYIDDLNTFDYPADIVVNYNIYGPELPYPQNKVYFLGPQYALLRKDFQGLEMRTIKERVENILVSTGGTDQHHVALRCAKHLQDHPPDKDVTFHLVLGAMNQDVEELKRIAAEFSFIKLHYQVKDMCSLMQQCDMAVSAAGTTIYELCACGLPTVTYILADNQIQGAQAFQRAGLMPCVGDVRVKGDFFPKLFYMIISLALDKKYREDISRMMRETVDGYGAKRLTSAINCLL